MPVGGPGEIEASAQGDNRKTVRRKSPPRQFGARSGFVLLGSKSDKSGGLNGSMQH